MELHTFLAACVLIERRPHCADFFRVQDYSIRQTGVPSYDGGNCFVTNAEGKHGPCRLLNLGVAEKNRYWDSIEPVSGIVRKADFVAADKTGKPNPAIALGLLDLAHAAARMAYKQ